MDYKVELIVFIVFIGLLTTLYGFLLSLDPILITGSVLILVGAMVYLINIGRIMLQSINFDWVWRNTRVAWIISQIRIPRLAQSRTEIYPSRTRRSLMRNPRPATCWRRSGAPIPSVKRGI